MEPHPLEAPEVLSKEPDEVAKFQFDFTDSQQLASSETLASIESATVTPDEELHAVTFSAIAGGPLIAGEVLTSDVGGDTAIAFESTSSGSATVQLVVAPGITLLSGEVLTGADSGATVTLSEDLDAGTKLSESPNIDGQAIAAKLCEITVSNGVRPIAGAPWREYLVRLLVRTSLGQDLVALGRLRIPEEAEAVNAR